LTDPESAVEVFDDGERRDEFGPSPRTLDIEQRIMQGWDGA
jgi:hypothetical protein